MTKAQRADALLSAAKYWQNGRGRPAGATMEATVDLHHVMCWFHPYAHFNGNDQFDLFASAALSEVCSLGFDIEGAEKVTSFEPYSCPCGSHKFYRAVRR